MKKPFEIRINSNGKWKKTKVFLNNQEIPCDSVYITGDKTNELTCVVALCTGVAEEAQEVHELQPAIGFHAADEYYEEDE